MSDLNLNQIQTRLNELFVTFGERKLIFWFDEKKDFEEDITKGEIKLDNAKIKIIDPHSQFLTKRFFEIEDKDNNYLIYAPFKRLDDNDENNHLLSILRYSKVFYADRLTIVMDQLGIESNLHDLMQKYHSFFGAKSRVNLFSKISPNGIRSREELEFTIMAVLTKANTPDLNSIIQALFSEYSAGRNDFYTLLNKFEISQTFWDYIRANFGYNNSDTTIQKLIIHFYVNSFYNQMGIQTLPISLKEFDTTIQVNAINSFMDFFMNDVRFNADFKNLSLEVYNLISGEKIINQLSIDELMDGDIFEKVQERVMNYYCTQLIREDITPTINKLSVEEGVLKRKRLQFGEKYTHQFDAIKYAHLLLKNVQIKKEQQFTLLIKEYETTTYLIDYYYRKYIWHCDQFDMTDLFLELSRMIEKTYKGFLDEISINWNDLLDINAHNSLLDFYEYHAQSNVKTVVIISDGLRFEAAKELERMLESDKKITSRVTSVLSTLPSVTEFGKAALLNSPNTNIDYKEGQELRVGDISTAGTINRNKILQKKNNNSEAITYSVISEKANNKELNEYFKGKELVYLYHDLIDKTGDHGQESQVFDAVHKTLEEIRYIITQLSSQARIQRVIITSDHGFLYRRSKIEEYEKIDNPSINESDRVERRFIISENTYDEIGVDKIKLGTVLRNNDQRFVYYPKTSSIFKKKGGGQNYVHGGSSPQELIVPVLELNISRVSSSKTPVEVELKTTKRKIIGLSISLEFYQKEAISDSVFKRRYQLYFEDKLGSRISNEHIYHADSRSTLTTDRFTSFHFDLVNRNYQDDKEIFLIIKDAETQLEIEREAFIVDNPFAGDFGFDLGGN